MSPRTGAAAVTAIVALLSACSPVVAGTPVAETTVSKTGPVNFPTTPCIVTPRELAASPPS